VGGGVEKRKRLSHFFFAKRRRKEKVIKKKRRMGDLARCDGRGGCAPPLRKLLKKLDQNFWFIKKNRSSERFFFDQNSI